MTYKSNVPNKITLGDLVYVVNGVKTPVVLNKKGDKLDISLIPPELLKKSLDVGILGYCLRTNSIIVDNVPGELEMSTDSGANSVADFSGSSRKVVNVIKLGDGMGVADVSERPAAVPETKPGVGEKDVKKEAAPKDFKDMGFQEQLDYIKKSDDVEFLNNARDTSESKQIKNNVTRRLKALLKK